MADNDIINVDLFGVEIGRIGLDENRRRSSFQYNPDFLESNKWINIFPETGSLKRTPYVQLFGQYYGETFKGLPPQIADSLPDHFGSLIFKAWLETKKDKNISALEQLAYVANRGMGALEYRPSKALPKHGEIDLDEIIAVLKEVLDLKKSTEEKKLSNQGLINVFKIGTSAGGARPKILISENKNSGKIIPGDLEYSDAYEHYLVKLDLKQDGNYPREIIEYIYNQLLKTAGITVMASKLIDDKHFATQRYDRQHGEKQHVLTVTGMTGWDFKDAEKSSYENLFKLGSFLKISHTQTEELFRRMVFNVVYANTDDHLKNHAFIYDKEKDGWELAPAYDVTFATNPLLEFRTTSRALSINGKRNNITIADFLKISDNYTVKNPKGIIRKVQDQKELLLSYLKEYEVSQNVIDGMMKRVKEFI